MIQLKSHFAFRNFSNGFNGRSSNGAEYKGIFCSAAALAKISGVFGHINPCKAQYRMVHRKPDRTVLFLSLRVYTPGGNKALIQPALSRLYCLIIHIVVAATIQVLKSKKWNSFPGPQKQIINRRKRRMVREFHFWKNVFNR